MSGMISLTAVVVTGTITVMGALILARKVIEGLSSTENFGKAEVMEYTVEYVDAA